MDFIESYQEKFNKLIDFLKKDVQSLRTNRVSTELVAHILVDVYGAKTRIDQLASLSTPEPRLILIQPWDKNVSKNIEQALTTANLGAVPTLNEGFIRFKLPSLNEETRKGLTKVLHEKLEDARRSLRNIRDEIRERIVKDERAKEISEDDKYRLFNELDELSRKKQEEIKLIGQKKQEEIMVI